jgi:hypothetical protein
LEVVEYTRWLSDKTMSFALIIKEVKQKKRVSIYERRSFARKKSQKHCHLLQTRNLIVA